jgi:hypothetical protein
MDTGVKEISVVVKELTGWSMRVRPTAGTACTILVHATLRWYGMRKRRPTIASFYPAMVKQRGTFGCRSQLAPWQQSVTEEAKGKGRREWRRKKKKKLA